MAKVFGYLDDVLNWLLAQPSSVSVPIAIVISLAAFWITWRLLPHGGYVSD